MRKDQGRVARLPVRIDGGETVDLAVRLVFGPDGALLRIVVPPAGTSGRDPRQAAAHRLVAAIDAELARPDAPGMEAVRRGLELRAQLAEDLVELEARHGPAIARTLRLAEA